MHEVRMDLLEEMGKLLQRKGRDLMTGKKEIWDLKEWGSQGTLLERVLMP